MPDSGLCALYDHLQRRELEKAGYALEICGRVLFQHAFNVVPIRVFSAPKPRSLPQLSSCFMLFHG